MGPLLPFIHSLGQIPIHSLNEGAVGNGACSRPERSVLGEHRKRMSSLHLLPLGLGPLGPCPSRMLSLRAQPIPHLQQAPSQLQKEGGVEARFINVSF